MKNRYKHNAFVNSFATNVDVIQFLVIIESVFYVVCRRDLNETFSKPGSNKDYGVNTEYFVIRCTEPLDRSFVMKGSVTFLKIGSWRGAR